MADNNNQQNSSQSIQQKQDWTVIAIASFQFIGSLALLGYTIWKERKRRKVNAKLRLMRKESEIVKDELYSQWRKAKLALELESIKREIRHESQLRDLEIGLDRKEEKEIISEAETLVDNLKAKGESLSKLSNEHINKAKEHVDKAKEKVKDLGKGIGDKVNDLKDKFGF